MKRITLLLYLFSFFLPLHLFAQHNNVDSLKVVLESSVEKSQQLELSLNIARYTENKEEVFKFTAIAYQLAKEQQDSLAMLKSTFYEGQAHRKLGQNEKAILQLEKATALSESLQEEVWMVNSWIELSKAYNTNGLYKRSVPILKRVIALPPNDGQKLRVAYNQLGITFNRLSQFDTALVYLHKLYSLSEENADSSSMARALINQGVAYNRMGHNPKALEVYNKCIEILKQQKDSLGLSSVYHNIGKIHKKLGDTDLAMTYYEKSLELKLYTNNIEGAGRTYNNMANILTDEKKYEEGLNYYQKAYALHLKTGNRRSQALTLANIADAYSLMGQYDSALEYGYNALAIHQEINSNRGLSYTLKTIATTYLKLQKSPDPTKVNKYGKKSTMEIETMLLDAKDLTEGSKDFDSLIDTYYALVEFYKDQNRPKEALLYQEKYITAKDSVYSIEKLAAITEIQTRLDTESKIKENAYLKENNLLVKSRNQTYLFVAIVLLILLISALLFYLKLRSAKQQLEIQNKTIEKQNTALTKLNETKDRFFGIIAHDLKSPLIALQGLGNRINFLLERNDRQQLDEIGQQVDQTTTKLNDLLDNLLGWSSVQTGNIPYHPTIIKLSEIAEEVILLFDNLIQINNLTVQNKISADIQVFADERALNTILRNLISNAIKFTPASGTIELETFEEGSHVFVSIKDNGLGIPSALMDKLFSSERLSSPGARGDKGTGLGLLLCKELLEVNKGTIEVKSKEKEGSVFSFSIPGV